MLHICTKRSLICFW